MLCYLTPAEHLGLPNEEEVKEGLIAYKISVYADDLVKISDKAINWDKNMTEARRALDWKKQLSLSIASENTGIVYYRHNAQYQGNNVPCTMCGSAFVYIMLIQQRKYDKRMTTTRLLRLRLQNIKKNWIF